MLAAFPFPPGAEDAAARARALPRSNQARKREVGLLAKFLSDDDEVDPEGTKGAEAFAAAVAAAGAGRPVGAAAAAAGAAAELWRDLLLGDAGESGGDDDNSIRWRRRTARPWKSSCLASPLPPAGGTGEAAISAAAEKNSRSSKKEEENLREAAAMTPSCFFPTSSSSGRCSGPLARREIRL